MSDPDRGADSAGHSLYAREERASSFLDRTRHGHRHSGGGHKRRGVWVRMLMVAVGLAFVVYAGIAIVEVVQRTHTVRQKLAAERAAAAAGATAEQARMPAAKRQEPDLESGAAEVKKLIADAEKAHETVREADLMLGRGMVQEAAEKLQRQLTLTPRNLDVRTMLAGLYLNLKRYDAASSLIMEVLAVNPRDIEARKRLAEILYARTEYSSSYEVCRWVLDSNAEDLETLKLASRACIKAGWYEVAINHLRTLYDKHHEDGESRNLLALAYLRLGQYGKAINHLDELIRDGQADPAAYYNLAVCYAQQKQAKDAVDVLTKSMGIMGPQQVFAWMTRDDFEPLRNAPLFAALRAQISQGMAATSLSINPEAAARADRELGLMPAPDLGSRPGGAGTAGMLKPAPATH